MFIYNAQEYTFPDQEYTAEQRERHRALLRGLLSINPDDRLSPAEALNQLDHVMD